MEARIITGHYRQEGGSLEPGRLLVLVDQDGTVLSESGGEIKARTYQAADGVKGVELHGNTIAFDFLPDDGECERVGIAISQ